MRLIGTPLLRGSLHCLHAIQHAPWVETFGPGVPSGSIFRSRQPPVATCAMPANLKQRAKRALVTLLLALAGAYGLQVTLTRESTDVEVTRVFRRVSIKVHPDKGYL